MKSGNMILEKYCSFVLRTMKLYRYLRKQKVGVRFFKGAGIIKVNFSASFHSDSAELRRTPASISIGSTGAKTTRFSILNL